MVKKNPVPNELFWQARQRVQLSRSEVADVANRNPVMHSCGHAPMNENLIGRIEQGRIGGGMCRERVSALCAVLGTDDPAGIGLLAERRLPTRTAPARPRKTRGSAESRVPFAAGASEEHAPAWSSAADSGLRRRVEGSLNDIDVPSSSLDEWEETVARHARDTRYRPAAVLLDELLVDVDAVQQMLRRPHTASGMQRASTFVAQMAGLLSLTLLKLNEFAAARQWGCTARIFAAECRDPSTTAWVWAQEAHRHFYTTDLNAAINAAQRAQAPAAAGRVGAVLGAALEARARASIGDPQGTRLALSHAESLLAGLEPKETASSALGYDEAQLHFHAGNAFTHLGDSTSAWRAQERALKLYPAANYLDRTLIHLDHAACLIQDGDTPTGSGQVVDILTALPDQQLDRLILSRAQAVIDQIPNQQAHSSAVREARELLTIVQLKSMESSS